MKGTSRIRQLLVVTALTLAAMLALTSSTFAARPTPTPAYLEVGSWSPNWVSPDPYYPTNTGGLRSIAANNITWSGYSRATAVRLTSDACFTPVGGVERCTHNTYSPGASIPRGATSLSTLSFGASMPMDAPGTGQAVGYSACSFTLYVELQNSKGATLAKSDPMPNSPFGDLCAVWFD